MVEQLHEGGKVEHMVFFGNQQTTQSSPVMLDELL